MRGYSFLRRIEAGDLKTDHVLEFGRGAQKALAAWTASDQEHEIAIPLPGNSGTLVSYAAVRGDESHQKTLMGDENLGVRTRIAWKGDGLTLAVSPWPKYVLIGEPL